MLRTTAATFAIASFYIAECVRLYALSFKQ